MKYTITLVVGTSLVVTWLLTLYEVRHRRSIRYRIGVLAFAIGSSLAMGTMLVGSRGLAPERWLTAVAAVGFVLVSGGGWLAYGGTNRASAD